MEPTMNDLLAAMREQAGQMFQQAVMSDARARAAERAIAETDTEDEDE